LRPLEVLLAILILPLILWPGLGSRPRPKWLAWLPLTAGAVLPLQLALEGYRWQMLPLYILTFLSILAAVSLLLRRRTRPARRGCLPVIITFFSLFIWLLAAALPAIMPIPVLPQPTGSYPVGTLSEVLVDPVRLELYGDQAGAPRRVMLQLWYPASPGPEIKTALWVNHPDIVAPRLARWLGLPDFMLNHLNLAYTQAYDQAAIAPAGPGPARYPILLFSHGWAGLSAQNTYQAEELASHGFVVAALQHTYGSVATVFPDGQVIPLDPEALPQDASQDLVKAAGNRLVNQWAGDLSLTLDHLADLDQSDPQGRFTGRLDLDQVGVFGHSTGGGAAIEFCGQDPRCKAGLTMDAYMLPVSDHWIETGLPQPFFFMFSQDWPYPSNNQRFEALFDRMNDHAEVVMIQGTNHMDFTDLPYFSPLAPWLGLKGPLPASQLAAIIKAYSLTFFAQVLDYPTALPPNPPPLDQPSPAFPQLKFEPQIFDWSP
jgi:dienelactone hydrolase